MIALIMFLNEPILYLKKPIFCLSLLPFLTLTRNQLPREVARAPKDRTAGVSYRTFHDGVAKCVGALLHILELKNNVFIINHYRSEPRRY